MFPLEHTYPGFSECIRLNRGETKGVVGKINRERRLTQREPLHFPPNRYALSSRASFGPRRGHFEVRRV